jgi:hypothetical protein
MGSLVPVKDHTVSAAAGRNDRVLALEFSEIRDISEIISRKLEKQIAVLRELEATVDKKRAALEHLIAAADAKTNAGAAGATGSGGKSALAIVPASADALGNRLAALESRVRTDEALLAAAGKKIAALERMLLPEDPSLPSPISGDRSREIAALHGRGLACREIAEVLGMPQGEVELILELKAKAA